jgi:hypothetical protein
VPDCWHLLLFSSHVYRSMLTALTGTQTPMGPHEVSGAQVVTFPPYPWVNIRALTAQR